MSTKDAMILIVDDDVDLRETMRDLLVDEGYSVAEASDGANAMTYLMTHERPKLILLDLMMPNMDGVQFRGEQTRNPELAKIPTVLLTASMHAEATRAANADLVLLKPLRLEPLLEVVSRYVSGA
ncbi:response regulator [Myxococcota bacterium]|nr:response regulator [Myxococcota bacterium]